MSTEPLMKLEVEEGVATLTINRPQKMNAFTVPLIREWDALLGRVLEDDAIRVLILTGAGRAFCAGGDIDDIENILAGDALSRKHYLWPVVHNIADELERLDKPVLAALSGTARGAGLDMALMCDLRFAAHSVTVAESYINLALIAGDGGTWFLPRIVGTSNALDMFWTGDPVRAEEAFRIGLVNRLYDDDKLMDETRAYASRLAAQPQETIRIFKRATYQGMTMSRRTHFDMISSHMSMLFHSDDHRAKLSHMLQR